MVKWFKEIKDVEDFRQLVAEIRKISFEDDLDVEFELPQREFEKFDMEDLRAFCFLTECPYVGKITRRDAPEMNDILIVNDWDGGDYVEITDGAAEVITPQLLTGIRESAAYWATEIHLCK